MQFARLVRCEGVCLCFARQLIVIEASPPLYPLTKPDVSELCANTSSLQRASHLLPLSWCLARRSCAKRYHNSRQSHTSAHVDERSMLVTNRAIYNVTTNGQLHHVFASSPQKTDVDGSYATWSCQRERALETTRLYLPTVIIGVKRAERRKIVSSTAEMYQTSAFLDQLYSRCLPFRCNVMSSK